MVRLPNLMWVSVVLEGLLFAEVRSLVAVQDSSVLLCFASCALTQIAALRNRHKKNIDGNNGWRVNGRMPFSFAGAMLIAPVGDLLRILDSGSAACVWPWSEAHAKQHVRAANFPVRLLIPSELITAIGERAGTRASHENHARRPRFAGGRSEHLLGFQTES